MGTVIRPKETYRGLNWETGWGERVKSAFNRDLDWKTRCITTEGVWSPWPMCSCVYKGRGTVRWALPRSTLKTFSLRALLSVWNTSPRCPYGSLTSFSNRLKCHLIHKAFQANKQKQALPFSAAPTLLDIFVPTMLFTIWYPIHLLSTFFYPILH